VNISVNRFVAQLAIAATLLASPLPASARAFSKGMMLSQVSSYYGVMKTKVCLDGVRVETGRLRLIVPPAGHEMVFANDETKCYAVQKITSTSYPRVPGRVRNPYVFVRQGTLCGLKARWFHHDSNLTRGVTWLYASANIEELPIKQEMADAVSAFCLLPSGQGLPLLIERTTPDHVTNKVLNTIKVEEASFTPDSFQIPKGYQRIGTVVAVLTGHKKAAADKDLNEWLKEPADLSEHKGARGH